MKSMCRNMGREEGRTGRQNIDRLSLESGAMRENLRILNHRRSKANNNSAGARRPGLHAVSGKKRLLGRCRC